MGRVSKANLFHAYSLPVELRNLAQNILTLHTRGEDKPVNPCRTRNDLLEYGRVGFTMGIEV